MLCIQLEKFFSDIIKNDDDNENDNEQKTVAIGGHFNTHKTLIEMLFSALASSFSSEHP